MPRRRISNFETSAAIARLEPFKTHTGSLRGEQGGPSSTGRLPSKHLEELAGHNVDYTVMSYATPIAWHHEGGWHYPDVSYSRSTSRHQSAVRRGIGIMNPREQRAEAKRRAAAQD